MARIKIIKGYNDLATTNPELLEERDFEKNEKLGYSPYDIPRGASIKPRWKCKKGHERQAIVYSRTKIDNPMGCPYCSNQRVLKGYNDLVTTHPQIAKQRNYDRNGNITPDTVNAGSQKKYWWICEKGHERETTIASRSKGNGNCPYCLNQKTLKGYNDLATTHPELLKERDYEKNGNVTPDSVNVGSHKKFWRKCEKGHEWETKVFYRTQKKLGCPYCGNQKVRKGYNDLETTNPTLLKERDYEKNLIKPFEVQAGSELKVRWICPRGHSYKAQIDVRAKRNGGCPICSKGLHTSFPEKTILYYFLKLDENILENYKNEKIGITELDIFVPDKKIAVEYDGNRWHSDKERDLSKNDICKNNGITLYRIREYGCPVLGSSSIDLYVNDGNYKELGMIIKKLIHDIFGKDIDVNIDRDKADIRKFMDINAKNSADKLPDEIIKQWDYEKNKGLEPSSFSQGTHRKVRWICDKGHSYEASIANRKRGNGCPYCGNQKLLKGYNDLATLYPELLKERDYEKNGDLKPDEVTSKNKKRVRRKCEKGHSYDGRIYNRANGKGCPYCINRKVIQGYNDLATTNPELLKQWNYEKNGNLKPTEVISGSRLKAWRKCEKGHERETIIQDRARGTGCPYCSNKKVLAGYNDLTTTNPELAKQWNYDKNKDLKPTEVTQSSGKKVWWICEKGHEWESTIANRTKGNGCPYCAGKRK